jgi:hypothetical protein
MIFSQMNSHEQNPKSPMPEQSLEPYSKAVIGVLMEFPIEVLETVLRILKSAPAT